jgi:hypothetical protein
MKLTDEKINHLTHLIYDALYKADKLIDMSDDDVAIRGLIKRSLREQMAVEEAMEDVARQKIVSQSRSIPEGGREWEILMEKYLEEEWGRKAEE